MARLTVSYLVTFIPGLPRPLALTEVIDDVIGLSSFPTRHTVRKLHGAPDRIDVVVPFDALAEGLDHAASAAEEITRIGESLLGLGFVLEERSVRVDGLDHGWLPETFGAGSRPRDPSRPVPTDPLPDVDWIDDPHLDAGEEDEWVAADDPRLDPIPDHSRLLGTDVGNGDPFGAGGAAPARSTPRPRPAVRRAPVALLAIALAAVVAPWRLAITPGSIGVAVVVALLIAAATAWSWVWIPGRAARVATTGAATLALVLAFASAYAVAARNGDLRRAPAAVATTRIGAPVTTFGQALSASVSFGAAPGLTVSGGALRVAYLQRLLLLALLVTVLVQGGLMAPRAVREARLARLGED